jgi:hypothetical protein
MQVNFIGLWWLRITIPHVGSTLVPSSFPLPVLTSITHSFLLLFMTLAVVHLHISVDIVIPHAATCVYRSGLEQVELVLYYTDNSFFGVVFFFSLFFFYLSFLNLLISWCLPFFYFFVYLISYIFTILYLSILLHFYNIHMKYLY